MPKMCLWATAVALILIGTRADAAGQSVRTGATDGRTVAKELVGTWRATPDRMPLTTDFDRSVWGPDASSVREVELVVRPSGEATLTVTRRVEDAKGRARPASTSIEQAQLVIAGSEPGIGPRIEHGVTVVRAERRYPDDPKDTWPIEGLRVRVVSFSDAKDTIEVRFDTPEGRGSFWETLRPAGRRGR